MFNKVKKPDFSLSDVYKHIGNIRTRKHSTAIDHFLDPLTKIKLYKFENEYEKFKGNNKLITPINKINNLSKQEANDLYTYRFKQSGCRNILINEFDSNFKSHICPVCERDRRNGNIDHILPKE